MEIQKTFGFFDNVYGLVTLWRCIFMPYNKKDIDNILHINSKNINGLLLVPFMASCYITIDIV